MTSSLFAALDCDAKEFDLRRIRPLLRDTSSVNAVEGGRTPLSVAVERRLTSAVRLLLSTGAVRDLLLPLITAVRMCDAATATLLLEKGAPINAVCAVSNTSPLVAAVRVGDAAMVTLLRQFGADVQLDDARALTLALELNEQTLLDALLADVQPIRQLSVPAAATNGAKRPADHALPPAKKPADAAPLTAALNAAFASLGGFGGMVSPVWRPGVPLEPFLAANRPSTADPFRVEWIYARSEQDRGDGGGDVAAAVQQYQRDAQRGVPVTAAYLAGLARQHGVLHGKWLVFARSDVVDAIWMSVARLVADGLVLTAKVGPRDANTGQHVVCVYVPDFGDERDVMRVRDLLRTRCNLQRKLSFKADIYTHLGIYAPQAKQLGISASIFSA